MGDGIDRSRPAVRVAPGVVRVLANNPSTMTLDGTNTYVVGGPSGCVVIDPGPALPDHLRAITLAARSLAEAGEAATARIAQVAVTHQHADHTEAVPTLVADGAELVEDPLYLRSVATPGHTAGCVSFLLDRDGAMLAGDFVLGRGSTVIQDPDGSLSAYMDSLERARTMVDEGRVRRILPGHGPVVEDPESTLRWYWNHRMERLEQIRRAMEAVGRDPLAVVRHVYVGLAEDLIPAALATVRAHIAFLEG